ncbi:MAG TPA: sensor histidine kinase [Verrucomicrobiae bacterium]
MLIPAIAPAQTNENPGASPAKRVLMIFSEPRDLPGNVMMEQAARAEITAHGKQSVEFFTESMDASHFPNARHYRVFQDYLKNRYAGQGLDLVMLFLSRDFQLAQELPSGIVSNLPTIFVVPNDMPVPAPRQGRPFTGIFQHFDVQGTMKFIFDLQPDTRHVIVVGGTSSSDEITLQRICEAASDVEGVDFEFWTNRPVDEIYRSAKSLPEGTVILLGTVQRDGAGVSFHTSSVAQRLATAANAPVYVLAAGLVGTGAVGGNVTDLEALGADAGKLALQALAGTPVTQLPVLVRSNSVPMVDWRTLRRWDINPKRLPDRCVIRYRPVTLWAGHRTLILSVAAILVAQAMTITALLAQRSLRRQAEAEILKQRIELAHVARVSTMGQLASALTHELNQPLGAILRNAEAAEIYLQASPPNLPEVQAILTDIRRDDRRAGDVIDRMRNLLKRQQLISTVLDLREVVEDTMAIAEPDATARRVRLKLDMAADLPPAQGDRVHVQQVLLNLILNGMDAVATLPKSRRQLLVQVKPTGNGNLQLSVSDEGVGVAPDAMGRIFEPFYTTKPNGMGMGLAISKTIIEAHGGELWIRSRLGEGTTVTFLLPPAGLQKIKAGDLPAGF